MKISAIVCTYNRELFICETIDSLLVSLTGVKDFEIVIIDNNSSDHTPELLLKYRDHSYIKCVKEEAQGLSHARNRGITEATGDILVFLDDDIEIKPDYFVTLEKTFSDPDISIAGGKVLPFNVDIPLWLPERYYYLVSIFDMGDRIKTTRYIMGGNCAIRKELVDKVGFYNVELGRKGNNLMAGEENEYMDRITSLGYKIYYVPGLTIYHKINDKLNTEYVFNYAYQNGKSNAIQYRKTRGLMHFLKMIKQSLLLIRIGLTSQNNNEALISEQYALGYLGIKRTIQ